MFIDTHCHLDFPQFDPDRDQIIRAAKNAGVDYIVNIGSSLKSSQASLELSRKYDFIYASAGIHPHEADSFNQDALKLIREIAGNNKVSAIGEIGLDYFKNFSRPDNQRKMFDCLLRIAKDLGLPLIIHCRDAQDDLLAALKDYLPVKAVVHCFSGDRDFLDRCLGLGFFVSFTCNITYKKADNLREMVKAAPIEKIFLETDAPYLSPEGMRGKRNEPSNVKAMADEVSRIKGVPVEEVARITTQNAKDFFKIK